MLWEIHAVKYKKTKGIRENAICVKMGHCIIRDVVLRYDIKMRHDRDSKARQNSHKYGCDLPPIHQGHYSLEYKEVQWRHDT